MATDVERMVLELSADVRKLDAGMKQGQRIIQNSTRAIERDFQRMNQRTVGAVSSMSAGIKASLSGLALGVAAREVAQYADAWTRATNSLRASGLSVEDTAKRMDELVAISLRSRSALESTVTLYNRLTAASGELGVSQQQVARVVETVNKALATSNMTQGERASAVTQLAQGLGSGNLAGDELKAIRENSQVLAQAIADEFGVTIGELKKLGAEGELTSVRVFAAIEKASGKVDTAFGRTRATIDDALTNLQTKTIAFIGSLDASTGASAKFAAVVEFVANHLDEIATAAGAAAVVIGTGYATAMTVAAVRTGAATVSSIAYQVALMRMAAASAGTTTAQIALNAALTANPIGLVIVAVAALAGGLYLLSQRQTEAARTMEELAAQTTASDKALQNYEAAQVAAKNASGETARAARDNAAAMRSEAEAAIIAARALAAKATATAQSRLTAAQAAFSEATSTRARDPSEVAGQLAYAAGAQRNYTEASRAAAAAIREQIRQEQELARITAGVNLGGGGVGGGGAGSGAGGGSRARAVSAQAEEVDRLRQEVADLSYDILSDTEKAAVDLAKVRDTLQRAVAGGIITPTQAAVLEGGAAAQGMEKVGDASLTPLEDHAREIGAMIAEGAAKNDQAWRDQGRSMARNFVDVLAADDIWSAAGYKFREAAFNQLEDIFTNIFAQLMGGNAQGGGISGTVANVVGSLFGGRRALGGPVKAGQFYKVNENTPNSEYFAPKQDGYVGNLKPQRAQASRGPVSMTFRTEYNLQGAAGTEAILGTVQRMQSASERRILATVQAAAPNAQLEQQLLRG